MSLFTFKLVSTSRECIYKHAKQYFNISTLSAYKYKAIFLPSLAKTPLPINNQSAKDEATFNKHLQEKGLKKILIAKKRFDIKYQLENPIILILNSTKAKRRYQSNIKHKSKDYKL